MSQYLVEEAYPLELVSLSHSVTFTITAAEPFGVCWIATVTNLATGDVYVGNLQTMLWMPRTPIVRPGEGNLHIVFEARNISRAGNLTLTIKDDTGATLKTATLAAGDVGSGTQYVSIEWIGNMPARNYAITVSVTP